MFLHLLLYRVIGPRFPTAFNADLPDPSNNEISNAIYERTRYRTIDITVDTI
jgi:hypothetical protein